MSQRLIGRSPDLQRLRDEGYDIAVRHGHLVAEHVPYVAPDGKVKYGTIVSTLTLAGEVTTTPDTHVVMFAGEVPCDRDGNHLTKIINSSGHRELADGLAIQHTFSSKPAGGYLDYHSKMTTYIAILASQAQALQPDATAQTFPVVEDDDMDSVFKYLDTASSRAGIGAITARLARRAVAIIGLGGTGSYILDLVAKTPVSEIHLFDGDRLLQHNAFRSPGAPSLDQLRGGPSKVAHFAAMYETMRRGIVIHDYFVDDSNVDELFAMEFVFIAIDGGPDKATIVTRLNEHDIPFIDVGLGVYEVDSRLAGTTRVTTRSQNKSDHLRTRIPSPGGGVEDDYGRNIQIADLNALNAALAVIRWKKLCGFYNDLEGEHFSVYDIDGNTITNGEQV